MPSYPIHRCLFNASLTISHTGVVHYFILMMHLNLLNCSHLHRWLRLPLKSIANIFQRVLITKITRLIHKLFDILFLFFGLWWALNNLLPLIKIDFIIAVLGGGPQQWLIIIRIIYGLTRGYGFIQNHWFASSRVLLLLLIADDFTRGFWRYALQA